MFVSVIATSYSRFELVRELVASARAEFAGVEYEIVLVTSDPEDSHKIAWLKEQPDVTLVSFADRNPGTKRQKSLYVYENAGIEVARGEWVLIINDDSSVDPGTLRGIQEGALNYDIIILPTEIAYVSQGKRAPIVGRYYVDGAVRDVYLLDFAAYSKTALQLLGPADEGYDWYGRGGDMGIQAVLNSEIRVGVAAHGGLTHKLDLETRQPPHPSKDFWYMRQKWSHLLESKAEPRLEIDGLPEVKRPGIYQTKIWPLIDLLRLQLMRRRSRKER